MSRKTSYEGATALFHVASGDLPICVLACELLAKAVKRATDALAPIGATSAEVKRLDDEGVRVKALLEDRDFVGVPSTLLWALRAALSQLHDGTMGLQKKEADLLIENDETSTRLKQIGRILASLDVAGMGGEAPQ